MGPFFAVVFAGLGALTSPEPALVDYDALVLDAAYAEAQSDFDARLAELGLLGSAPLVGVEQTETLGVI